MSFSLLLCVLSHANDDYHEDVANYVKKYVFT
jgi:hypothetical protein